MDVLAEGLHDKSLPITPHYFTPVSAPGVLTLVIHHSQETLNLALVFLDDGMTDTIRKTILPNFGSSNRAGNATAMDVLRRELETVSRTLSAEEMKHWVWLGIELTHVEKVVLSGDDTGSPKLKHILSTLDGDLVSQLYRGLTDRDQRWGSFSSAIGAAKSAQEYMSVNWMEVRKDEL
jgi:hypothetical protein